MHSWTESCGQLHPHDHPLMSNHERSPRFLRRLAGPVTHSTSSIMSTAEVLHKQITHKRKNLRKTSLLQFLRLLTNVFVLHVRKIHLGSACFMSCQNTCATSRKCHDYVWVITHLCAFQHCISVTTHLSNYGRAFVLYRQRGGLSAK